MSTSKTKNYQLHSWAAQDDFLRTEFNDNFIKLDTALAAEATARGSAVNTLTTALGKKPEIVTGTYTGDGTKNRAINLGFAPKAVLVLPSDGRITATNSYYGGLALSGQPTAVGSNEMIALTATGFRVSHISISHTNYTEYVTANKNGTVYHYIAIK